MEPNLFRFGALGESEGFPYVWEFQGDVRGVSEGVVHWYRHQFEPNNACESEAYPVCNKFDRILAGSFDLESLAMTLVNQI